MTDLVTMHPDLARAAIPQVHPYLLGSRDDLIRLSHERPEDYARMAQVARHQDLGEGYYIHYWLRPRWREWRSATVNCT